MRFSSLSAATAALILSTQVSAQTYTDCDPREQTGCPADPALGGSAKFDFTTGAQKNWTTSGAVTYSSSTGAGFTVASQGDAPLITSDFYIMWGHLEVVMQSAPGTGIVSSIVMQSDTLDEIDLEFLGGQATSVQTNYFGHGDTSQYNREQTIEMSNNQNSFHTYTVDWTADRIVWQIDGTTVRSMAPADANAGQYPQTPMMIKIGIWAGGDPSNPSGTINWAGGTTDYSKGPFTMYCKSVSVIDYSTGSEYVYTSQSGTSDSISAVGGSVDGNMAATASVATDASAATITSSGGEAPIPWSGTHRETSSWSTPDIWPWVATATASVVNSNPSSGHTTSGSDKLEPLTVYQKYLPVYFISASLAFGFLFPLWR
ncbi:Concanavalin A-like lectin/glucanase, subgroup [Penicillium occitanis (nom. inval.)]|nr:Concanavalin A-like lectin/glucanase, subgroup [Penicillium occitanis (nom. inval.)]PCH01713.1 hypothetical protein PENOC_046930 [Penicillium occitanis (nom. inval.)]